MSKTGITSVRFATKDDIPVLLEMMGELAEFEQLQENFHTTKESLERSCFGEEKIVDVLIGFYQEVPAGYAAFYHNYSTFLARPGIFLEDLYVRQQFRGTGVGQALFGRLCQVAQDRGCARIEGMALSWNERARRYYEALGAEALEGWHYYRIPEKGIARLARRAARR